LGKPGGIRHVLKHAGGTLAQGFSPDGQWIATSGHDRRVLVRDRLTSELICPPLVHDDEVFDFEFSQDGTWLATACRDGRFHVWDTRSGTARLPVWSGDESLHSVKLVAQGRWAVLAGLGSEIWLRDLGGLQDSTDWSLKEMILLTEVVSGRAVDADPAASMTSEDWLERMSQIHRLRPSIFQP
jgi:WD40 repeat protein